MDVKHAAKYVRPDIVRLQFQRLAVFRQGQVVFILAVVIAAAALIAFATGTIAGAISNDSVANTVGFFNPLWEALRHLGFVVVAIITYLNSPLLLLLSWILDKFIGAFQSLFENGLEGIGILSQSPFADQVSDELIEATGSTIQFPRQLLTILIMFFIVLLVTLALGRLVRSLRPTSSGESRAMNPAYGYGSLPRPGFGQSILDRFRAFRHWRAAASVRHLYRHMCATAGEYGYPRSESETPYEYLQTLYQAWPEGVEDAKLITEAYVRVHYGEYPESKEELTEIEAAWKRLAATQPAETIRDKEELSIQPRPQN